MNHRFVSKWLPLGLVVFMVYFLVPATAHGQAGLRDALETLDKNKSGSIDPDEVTPLARPYLERILKARSRSDAAFYRPVSIERIQESARIYYAVKNGVSGRSVYPSATATVKTFGPADDEPMVPEFGLGKIRFPYTQDDIEETNDTMRRSDRNRDGMIDRKEAQRARWTHRDPFADDLNKDDRLSRMELIQRYARRRLLEGDSDELVQRARRVGNGIKSSRNERSRNNKSDWWRKGGSDYWLTASIMGRFDANRNGRLEVEEAQGLGFRPGQVDIDGDGILTREELFAEMTNLQNEAGDLTEGLPGWFFEQDANHDGQIAMHEFTDEWTLRKHQEFELLDSNSDGLLTSLEASRSRAAVGGSYQNEEAEVLPPRRTIISEIEVTDDYLISDLNVQISITHSHTSHLDGYLTGPDGQRIELFTEIGGSGDHFDQTTFDDQSKVPVTKAKSPFKGSFLPEGLLKKQPGLSVFNDKNVKGVWQLVIRGTRNDRFGLLHSWGLTVKPKEELPGSTLSDSMKDESPDDPAAQPAGKTPETNDETTELKRSTASAQPRQQKTPRLKAKQKGEQPGKPTGVLKGLKSLFD